MKNKVFKISVVLLIIMTMTLTNFLVVGNSFISYALDNSSTNNGNIEFGAYFKDENGNSVTSLEKGLSDINSTSLYLHISVKNEGYLDGKIELGTSNFNLKDTQNDYVNKIEGNTIILNRLNAGANADIEIPIEFKRDEYFDLSLLNTESEIRLTGDYKDSTEKNIEIDTTKKVSLILSHKNIETETSLEIMTNKIVNISGEEKRVVQFLLKAGVKDNTYPVKEMNVSVNVPSLDNKYPEVEKVINTTSAWDYEYKDGQVTINLKNELHENKVYWKKNGTDNIILTYIYDKDLILDNIDIKANTNITLYDDNNTKIDLQEQKVTVNKDEEKENILTTTFTNSEKEIFKGKLQEGIDRDYTTTTTLNVNMSNVLDEMEIREENVFATAEQIAQEEQNPMLGQEGNIVYRKTAINKNDILGVLGNEGTLTIVNENGEVLATINKDSQADEKGNIIVDYGEGQSKIVIKISKAIDAGKIRIANSKTIKATDENIIKNAVALKSGLYIKNNLSNSEILSKVSKVELKDSITDARLDINKTSLSTIVENTVEIRAILKTNNEKYDLYKNPVININLPEEVESIDIESAEIVYNDGLNISNTSVNGKTIVIETNGEQKSYTDSSIEGVMVKINAKLKLNRKSSTKDTVLTMSYINEKATSYASSNKEGTAGLVNIPIKVEAPTDVTTVNTISELGVEELEQGKTKEILLERGKAEKQINPTIEIINNKSNAIENVKIFGEFPTKSNDNNIETKIISPMSAENAKVYYTENESATSDLQNSQNGWTETINDQTKVKKYLIIVDKIESQNSIIATYSAQLPANLEYNQKATESYTLEYTDSVTKVNATVKSTKITMTTAKVGNTSIANNDEVKAGEVIKYQLEISNTGTEDATDIKVSANVPEGTTFVKPMNNYEYTGAAYYEENKEIKKVSATIEKLQSGAKVTKTFEVRVNSDVIDGTIIKNIGSVNYIDVTKNSNELQTVLKSGNLRASVKRVTDRDYKLTQYSGVQYFAIIENTSDKEISNVKVKTNLSEDVKIDNVSLITGLTVEEVKDEDLIKIDDVSDEKSEIESDNQKEANIETQDSNVEEKSIEDYDSNAIEIGSLKAGETKVLRYGIETQTAKIIDFSVNAIQGDNTYRSNEWTDTVNAYALDMSMTSNIQNNSYVKAGDTLEYTITARNNNETAESGIEITDEIPEQLTITKLTLNGQEQELPEDNKVYFSLDFGSKSEAIIKIEALVNYEANRDEAETITNKAVASVLERELASTAELTHIISANVEEGESENNDIPDNNIANGAKMISGVAWIDENSDGKKDDSEKTLNGVKVNLLNVETNQLVKNSSGSILEVTTNDKGMYVLNNIGNGKYVVIFNYDTTAYSLTKYKVEGIDESQNSNAMKSNVLVEGEQKDVTTTDIIQVANNNISNINIGLVQLKNFDLKLDKYVSKILVQNSTGTTTREYTNETMAKIELDAKQVNGSTVIIEYKLRITNAGEVDGYVKKLVDYAPSDLTFNSELNKDWYQQGSNLYNASLANDKIAAGETKEIKLTLVKSMNENNTGLVNNTAEIAEAYNELGLSDTNSTPGNKTQGENDMGSADVIISIRTGEMIIYTTIITIIIIGLLSVVIVPAVQRNRKNRKTHKLDKI